MDIIIKKEQSYDRYAQFNTTTEVGQSVIEMFDFPIRNLDIVDLAIKHGIPVAVMIYSLTKIKGVEHVFVKPYSISVSMERHFHWDRQIDKIVENSIALAAIVESLNSRPKLIVNSFPNQEVREYSLDVEICETRREMFYRPLRETSENPMNRLGKIGKALVKNIMSIPGVTEIDIDPYCLRIHIAEAFKWGDVEPLVIEAIARETGELQISRQK